MHGAAVPNQYRVWDVDVWTSSACNRTRLGQLQAEATKSAFCLTRAAIASTKVMQAMYAEALCAGQLRPAREGMVWDADLMAWAPRDTERSFAATGLGGCTAGLCKRQEQHKKSVGQASRQLLSEVKRSPTHCHDRCEQAGQISLKRMQQSVHE